jgi:hypothetical protein
MTDSGISVLNQSLRTTRRPTVAGWGMREKTLMLAFAAYAGLSETDGFLVSVLLGTIMFIVGVLGVVNRGRTEREKEHANGRENDYR